MIGYVYVTRNDVNDILYIGKKESKKFESWYKGSGTHFKLALKKYGKDKFHSSVLEWCETRERLCEAERKWIAEYRKRGIELYNIASGGEGGFPSWINYPKEKVDAINQKNREAHLGKKNGFYGKHHTEKTKEIIRQKNKNAVLPKELIEFKNQQRSNLPKVAQICKETGKVIRVWDNWCDASKAVSKKNRCGYAHIAQCCRHERRSAYGYRWEFAETGWHL